MERTELDRHSLGTSPVVQRPEGPQAPHAVVAAADDLAEAMAAAGKHHSPHHSPHLEVGNLEEWEIRRGLERGIEAEDQQSSDPDHVLRVSRLSLVEGMRCQSWGVMWELI